MHVVWFEVKFGRNWKLIVAPRFFFTVIFGIRQKPVSHLVKKNRKSLRRLLFSTIDDVTSFGLEKSAHEIDSSNWKWYGMLGRGGLISVSFSFWLKSPNNGVKSLSWALCTTKEKVLSELAPLFGDLSQNEKLSEIKPPLVLRCNCLEYP